MQPAGSNSPAQATRAIARLWDFLRSAAIRSAPMGLCLFTVTSFLPEISAAASNQVPPTAADILSLTSEQVTQKTSVSITGVVTLAEPTWGGLFFVQDSTGGVFVNNRNPRPALGDLVQVTGVGHAGG